VEPRKEEEEEENIVSRCFVKNGSNSLILLFSAVKLKFYDVICGLAWGIVAYSTDQENPWFVSADTNVPSFASTLTQVTYS
jgi:hypothetical protein